MQFSDALTHAREREKLTRYDLADATGVSYKHIANLEAGTRPPTLVVVNKLHTRLRFSQRVLLALFEACEGTAGRGAPNS